MGKREKAIFLVVLLVLVCALGYIALAAPGDASDPIVTLNYLKSTVLPDILGQVDTKINTMKSAVVTELKTEITRLVANAVIDVSYVGFKAVEVEKDSIILGHEGTEIILRAGDAVSVCPGQNGITDVTAGLDLANAKKIEKNHVYIIPREDGRGIKMTVEGFIMVKGAYDVVK